MSIYDTMILFITWNDQDESTFGQFYNSSGSLVYEGEMEYGVSYGKDTFFFSGGENIMGISRMVTQKEMVYFYWEDGNCLEGTLLTIDSIVRVFFIIQKKISFNATWQNQKK